jgi:hypothetical protein
VERETGFEPATSTLARLHSTTELFPQHRNIYYRCGASVNPIARAAIAHQRLIWIGLRNGKTGQAVPRSARDHRPERRGMRRERRDHKWLAHRHIGHGVTIWPVLSSPSQTRNRYASSATNAEKTESSAISAISAVNDHVPRNSRSCNRRAISDIFANVSPVLA